MVRENDGAKVFIGLRVNGDFRQGRKVIIVTDDTSHSQGLFNKFVKDKFNKLGLAPILAQHFFPAGWCQMKDLYYQILLCDESRLIGEQAAMEELFAIFDPSILGAQSDNFGLLPSKWWFAKNPPPPPMWVYCLV